MRWWKVLAVFAGILAAVWLIAAVAAEVIPRDYLYPRLAHPAGGPLTDMWMRWDASWYREIVRHGYRYEPGVQSAVAYFPAYPVAIAAVGWAFPTIATAGVALTVAAGAGAAVLFHRWCADRMTAQSALMALLVLLTYPYAWYLFGPVYSDAFFVCAVIAAFVLVERDHFVLAGLVGFVVTASRPTGIAAAIGLVLVVLERANQVAAAHGVAKHDDQSGARDDRSLESERRTRRLGRAVMKRFDPRAWSWRATPVLVSFGGLAAWASYLWVRFGDPLLFLHIESTWWQGAGPRTWLKVAFFDQIHNVPHSVFASSLMLHAVVALGAIALVPAVARRFGWGYAGYVLIVMGIPLLGTKDFMSSGRYLLAAFPLFALIGVWLSQFRSWIPRVLWLSVSAILLLVFTALWSAGKYLA